MRSWRSLVGMNFELSSEQLQTQPCLAQCSFSLHGHIYRIHTGIFIGYSRLRTPYALNATFQALHGHIIQTTAMAVTASILDKRSNLTTPHAWHPYPPAVSLETLRTTHTCGDYLKFRCTSSTSRTVGCCQFGTQRKY